MRHIWMYSSCLCARELGHQKITTAAAQGCLRPRKISCLLQCCCPRLLRTSVYLHLATPCCRHFVAVLKHVLYFGAFLVLSLPSGYFMAMLEALVATSSQSGLLPRASYAIHTYTLAVKLTDSFIAQALLFRSTQPKARSSFNPSRMTPRQ